MISRDSDYVARINKVIDYIEHHIDEDLNLEILANVASFSKYHFHRIFYAIIGETLYDFIQRTRLEKAASRLVRSLYDPIEQVAYDCGFKSPSVFSRAFKTMFHVTPSQWRKKYCASTDKSTAFGYSSSANSNNCQEDSNFHQSNSNNSKDYSDIVPYFRNVNFSEIIRRLEMYEKMNFDVIVKDMEAMNVAYVRHIGPYKENPSVFEGLINKLFSWAGPRNLVNFPDTKLMFVYHDNPDITEESKLRVSACITVPESTEVSGEIGKMVIPAGKYAMAHFEINGDEYEQAWNAVFASWLPQSGYQPADGLCYELSLNDPKEHPQKKHIVDICFPVKLNS